MTHLIDLSVPLEDSPSEPQPVSVRHVTHAETAAQLMQIFGCERDDLPGGLGWAVDILQAGTHAGTHVDAPWHYFPTSEGKPARTIDQLPLDWFFSDGVVLDFRSKDRGSVITPDDLEHELERIGYTLKPRDIVLLHTGTDAYWGSPQYTAEGSGLSALATRWLCDRGVKVIGTDAWGLDRPFWAIREHFAATHDPATIWEAHRVGIDHEYCQIEKLANLDRLPRPFGFRVSCFPVKITGASAGWSRVVAFVEDDRSAVSEAMDG